MVMRACDVVPVFQSNYILTKDKTNLGEGESGYRRRLIVGAAFQKLKNIKEFCQTSDISRPSFYREINKLIAENIIVKSDNVLSVHPSYKCPMADAGKVPLPLGYHIPIRSADCPLSPTENKLYWFYVNLSRTYPNNYMRHDTIGEHLGLTNKTILLADRELAKHGLLDRIDIVRVSNLTADKWGWWQKKYVNITLDRMQWVQEKLKGCDVSQSYVFRIADGLTEDMQDDIVEYLKNNQTSMTEEKLGILLNWMSRKSEMASLPVQMFTTEEKIEHPDIALSI